jgi:hypothetical protein
MLLIQVFVVITGSFSLHIGWLAGVVDVFDLQDDNTP